MTDRTKTLSAVPVLDAMHEAHGGIPEGRNADTLEAWEAVRDWARKLALDAAIKSPLDCLERDADWVASARVRRAAEWAAARAGLFIEYSKEAETWLPIAAKSRPGLLCHDMARNAESCRASEKSAALEALAALAAMIANPATPNRWEA